MRRVLRISLVCMTLALIGATTLTSEASGGATIKPGQHFRGLVNGKDKAPVVRVACPGPVGANSTGSVVSKQTMAVVHVRKGHGYTGLFSSIYSWFEPTTSGVAPTELHFARYASPLSIPTSIKVPCGGTGHVVFSSCPYLAPCAAGWVIDTVKVKFENVAA